jgi:hypothetical protein
MANDPMYDPLRNQAIQLHRKVQDFIGNDYAHPSASMLQREVRELQEDFETGKHPRSIEGRIKTIQNQLRQTQNIQNSYMNYNEFDYLHDNFEEMRMTLRKLNNY